LDASIPQDIETIVMKAMEKNSADRYGTAKELAEDLRLYVGNRPILARPPTVRQRITKWSRRHRTLVHAGFVVLVLLLIGSVTSTLLISQAKKEAEDSKTAETVQRRHAEEKVIQNKAILGFIVKEMLGASASEAELSKNLTVAEMLTRTEAKLDEAFPGQPGPEATVRHTMGVTYYRLGQYERAEDHLRRARELIEPLVEPEDEFLVACSGDLANALRRLNRLEESRQLYEETIATRQRVFGEDDPQTAGYQADLANVYFMLGKVKEAVKTNREVLALLLRLFGSEDQGTLRVQANLGMMLEIQGELHEAFELQEQAWNTLRRKNGDKDYAVLGSQTNLARLMFRLGRRKEALQMNVNALRGLQEVLSTKHPDVLGAMHNFANLIADAGEFQDAIRLHRETLDLRRKALGENHRNVFSSMADLAWILATCPEDKGRDCRRALGLAEAVVKGDSKNPEGWRGLGAVYYRNGDWNRALEAFSNAGSLFGDPESETLFLMAMTHQRRGEPTQAKVCFDKAVRALPKNVTNADELDRLQREAAEVLAGKGK
jgi:tetratricopeptide (TPR) repeat protein